MHTQALQMRRTIGQCHARAEVAVVLRCEIDTVYVVAQSGFDDKIRTQLHIILHKSRELLCGKGDIYIAEALCKEDRQGEILQRQGWEAGEDLWRLRRKSHEEAALFRRAQCRIEGLQSCKER